MTPVRAVALVVAVLDPGGIPAAALRSHAVAGFVAEFVSQARGVRVPDAVRRAVRELVEAGTIEFDRSTPSREIRLSPRRQHDILDTHAASDVAAAIRAAADALMETRPQAPFDDEIWWSWRSNARCLAARRPRVLWDPEGHGLLFALGLSLAQEGPPDEAFDYWQGLLVDATEYLEPEHPQRLATRAVLTASPNEMKRLGGLFREV